ncbi:hypothetical protein AB0C15_20385 [Micromonospora sp. NPDC048835]|uniref:hypothetical protein n=1 Tax=Micromonospora sp. NPDC048835 TaxID=3155147 RepID=UPI0033DF7E90
MQSVEGHTPSDRRPTVARRSLLTGGAVVAASLAGQSLVGSSARGATAGTELSVGRVDITPTAGAFLAGYGVDVPRRSTGTAAALFARCTILWSAGVPHVIVTADVLGFARGLHRAIRSQVLSLGVASENFALTATHTHNGPVLTDKLDPFIAYAMTSAQQAEVRAYSDQLAARIAHLVGATLAGPRTACTLDYQVVSQHFSYNREGLPYVEADVPVLTARTPGGEPRAVLFSYGCHPVTAGSQTMFDPDYPGDAAARIEQATGAFAQFLLGPAGDQDPVGGRGWAQRELRGTELAQAVTTAALRPGRPVAGPTTTHYREVSLPLDVTPTADNLRRVSACYTARAANTGLPGYHRRHARQMISQIEAGTFATSIPVPVQSWRFSGNPDLQLLLAGGEIVSGYAVYFRARHGTSSRLLFAGYANEVPAYLPSDELPRRSSTYAGGIDSDFPGIAGGSMTVYGWLGHLRGKPTATSPDGAEQILIGAIEAALTAAPTPRLTSRAGGTRWS